MTYITPIMLQIHVTKLHFLVDNNINVEYYKDNTEHTTAYSAVGTRKRKPSD